MTALMGLLLLVNFVSRCMLELMYISHIVNIRSSQPIEIDFFAFTNRINLLNLK